MNKTLIFLSVIIFALIIGGCTTLNVSTSGSENLPPVAPPEAGDTITITNCKADPSILQVRDKTEVTFVNSDSQEHTIFIENQEVNLPAQGSAKFVATSSTGTQITTNYLCDQEYGGAIFIT